MVKRMYCMQEAGVSTDESGWEIVGGKQYSCNSGNAAKLRVEEAGVKEGRDKKVVW